MTSVFHRLQSMCSLDFRESRVAEGSEANQWPSLGVADTLARTAATKITELQHRVLSIIDKARDHMFRLS